MIKDIKSTDTKKLTISRVTITLNFSKDRNISSENSVGKLLLENMFKEGSNEETSKDSVS